MDSDMKSCCWTEAARGRSSNHKIDHDEQVFIHEAFKFLDRPGFLMRVANVLGKPLEAVIGTLPSKHQSIIHRASQAALKRGLEVVTTTVSSRGHHLNAFSHAQKNSRNMGHWHSLASFGVGAAGGFFGVLSLPIELPITTAIILRSIAAIAHEFGMDLHDPQVQLECLYILSLGSSEHRGPNAVTSAYWTSRVAYAQMAREAASYLANKTAQEILREVETKSAPVLVRFMTSIAARFEVVVSEKLMAEALPVVGAIGGGMINAAFTEYFSDAARFHFGLRALESRHGREAVEGCYNHEVRVC